ncbi:Arc-like DNA binding domain protein [Caballeronia sordidicola]|uniref:Arc-like DNA binding domain protein n=1 Tax=Caballeronia sordidicola TaxID=196367 RepID=A0A158EWM0_CABSO|nr:Arc family DNA-binding protein [Caballeronia sordidicola]SAL11961.1 Arc-like DNA binding domain protein [Caballeronia sordidicola]
MARDDPQINLRIPADLKDRLDRASLKTKRSLTAEVVARLEETFRAGNEKDAPPAIDTKTMDLFADHVAGKVVKALNEIEKKRTN